MFVCFFNLFKINTLFQLCIINSSSSSSSFLFFLMTVEIKSLIQIRICSLKEGLGVCGGPCIIQLQPLLVCFLVLLWICFYDIGPMFHLTVLKMYVGVFQDVFCLCLILFGVVVVVDICFCLFVGVFYLFVCFCFCFLFFVCFLFMGIPECTFNLF